MLEDACETGDIEIVKYFAWSEMRMPIASVDDTNNIVYFTGKTGSDNKRIHE